MISLHLIYNTQNANNEFDDVFHTEARTFITQKENDMLLATSNENVEINNDISHNELANVIIKINFIRISILRNNMPFMAMPVP